MQVSRNTRLAQAQDFAPCIAGTALIWLAVDFGNDLQALETRANHLIAVSFGNDLQALFISISTSQCAPCEMPVWSA